MEKELLSTPTLYFSRYIIENKRDYYEKLLNITMKDEWEAWVLFMLTVVKDTAYSTTEKISAIRKLISETAEKMKTDAPGVYSHELTELIFIQPYCRISNVVEAGLAKRQTASVHLKTLCDIGVLEQRKAGREKLFINPAFLRLLKE